MTAPQSAGIVTTPHGSNLGDPAWSAFEAIKADLNQLWLTPGQVLFSSAGNITYSGASSAANSFLWTTGAILGTASAGPASTISPFFLDLSDKVDTTTTGPGNLKGMFLQLAPTTGHTGARETFEASLMIIGSPPTAPASGYVASTGITNCQANLTGTNASYFTTAGNVFAANFNVIASAAATSLRELTTCEFDVAIKTGGSAAEKFCININQTLNDVSRGVFDDAGLVFRQNDATTATWSRGISFGSYAHRWTFGADSTLIGAQQRQIGPASLSIALYGVDFRNCTFQTGGAAFISTGFQVDPTGQVVTQVATVATLPTGIKGGRAFVTDANATMAAGVGTIVAGGGANNVPVYFDGSAWRIG
jgi:hypothetical protein